MKDFLNQINSPSWWWGVVIVSIVLNVFSTYLKTGIDNYWSRYSKKRREKLSKIRTYENIKRKYFLTNPADLTNELIMVNQSKNNGLLFMLLGSILIVAASNINNTPVGVIEPIFSEETRKTLRIMLFTIFGTTSLMIMLFGFQLFVRSTKKSIILNIIRQRKLREFINRNFKI